MKQTSAEAVCTALITLLDELQKNRVPLEGRWAFERGPQGWRGSFVQKPSTYYLLASCEKLLENLSEKVGAVLTADYPDHMQWVGLPMSAGAVQPRMVLWRCAQAGSNPAPAEFPDKQGICREFSQETGRDRPTPRLTLLESNRFFANSLLNGAGNFLNFAGNILSEAGTLFAPNATRT